MAIDTSSDIGGLGPLWSGRSDLDLKSFMGMTVRDRVAHELRHRILTGAMRTGDRVDLDALATEFGSSRTPIREACLMLANDQLVEFAPRSGITILGVTAVDLLDNFEVMATLAGMAAGWAAERAEPEDLARISRLRDDVVHASKTGGDVAQINHEFHRAINQASHSRRLMLQIAHTAGLFPDRLSDVVPSQIPCSLREHADIVAALDSKNRAQARSLMEAHFLMAADRLRALLATPH